ncbi:hypothetical protein ACFOW4_24640 [Micromonospora sp. GCM10011542]|uniref:hypothetical protein n=1 Tax=Micromonospora sp. GCM10011542 TaxID=3317337 RepID=UPI00360AEB1A
MLTLTPVVSRVGPDVLPFDLWPVAAGDLGWLRLHGAMQPAEVGVAVWSLLFHSAPVGDDLAVPNTPAAALRLLSEFDTLYAPGGLLLMDRTTGVLVEPGCCCDLFEWRDWLGTLHGLSVDLGHSPAPDVEYRGEVVRVWTEGADVATPPADRTYVDVNRAALPGLLRSAQCDLIGFLEAARNWANRIVPEHADQFVAALDAGLQISEPLPL